MLSLFLVIFLVCSITVREVLAEAEYSSDIHVSEFLPRPAGGGTANEFIELHNASSQSQDLSGWMLDDIESGGSNPFIIPAGTSVPANSYLAFFTTSPHVSLNDTGDHVRLIRPDGIIQDDIVYTTSKEGFSYSRNEEGEYEESSIVTPNAANEFPDTPTPTPTLSPTPTPTPTVSLMPTLVPTPTPTPVESLLPTSSSSPESTPISGGYLIGIYVNEFLPNPKGDDASQEFIELYNSTDTSIDLSGWILDDGDGGSLPFHISDGTFIAPGEVLAFMRSQTKIALNNDSDHVRLLDPDEDIHSDVTYDQAKEGHSYNRVGSDSYEESSTITPGSTNIITAPVTPTPRPISNATEDEEGGITYQFSSNIFINEVLPNPKGSDDESEFIELKSKETKPVSLFGWILDDGEKGSVPYHFTKDDSIGAGKILSFSRSKTKIALNNDTDSVRLIDPNGKTVSEITYGPKVIEGQSYNRTEDEGFEWSEVITPNKENTIYIQEKVSPTPKLKVSKKSTVSKKSPSVGNRNSSFAAPRVLSTITNQLPWVQLSGDGGKVARSIIQYGESFPIQNKRQGVFVFIGLTAACMQMWGGISHKERIWQK